MAGAHWLSHKGKKVLFIDFSNSDVAEVKATIEHTKPLIAKEPQMSILCLVDATGCNFDIEGTKALQLFSAYNKPYIKMTAVTGTEGLLKVIYSGVLVFTRRKNIVLKSSREEALDWLISIP